MSQPVLSVENLTVSVQTADGWCPIVRDLSLTVAAGETLCLVGESGCGKSLTALAIMRLLPRGARIDDGHIRLGDVDLAACDEVTLRGLRGRDLAMIFQEPMTSLNPVLRIGEQVTEGIRRHEAVSATAARERALALFRKVRIPDPERRFAAYPHKLSGGMRQRVMIAMAIACRPKILIADEPTTALDVTVQAQILNLLRDLRAELGMSVILISHDMGVISEFTDRIAVMYAGQVVEQAAGSGLFEQPMHPYTDGLLRAIPDIDADVARLATIPGSIPDPAYPPAGCRFHPRCPEAIEACTQQMPAMIDLSAQHQTRCPPRAAGRMA